MIINKLEALYTEEEKKRLKKLQEERQQLHIAISLQEKKIALDRAKDEGLIIELSNLQEEEEATLKAIIDIEADVEDRYIAAFNGKLEAVVVDATQIINSITKEDYLEETREEVKTYKENAELLEASIKDAETLEGLENKENLIKNLTDRLAFYKAKKARNYDNYSAFIRKHLNTQHRALYTIAANNSGITLRARDSAFYMSAQEKTKIETDTERYTEAINRLIDEAAAKEYSRPKSSRFYEIQTLEKETNPYFYNYPTGEISFYLLDAYRNLSKLDRLAEYIQANTKGKRKAKVEQGADSAALFITGDKYTIGIEINQLENAKKYSLPITKLFKFLLIKINEQCLYKGELIRDSLTFDIQELVDNGLYNSLQSARNSAGFAFDNLQLVRIKGNFKIHKKEKATANELALLFPSAAITNNLCQIAINPYINWTLITRYFTILPKYYFTLPPAAQTLEEYIFYRARQSIKTIKGTDFTITINMRQIQRKLGLPEEKDTKDAKGKIKDKILAAIKEIQEAEEANEDALLIELIEPVGCSKITDFLDNAYIEITIRGNYFKHFNRLESDVKRKISANVNRKEKQKSKYITKAQQKKITKDVIDAIKKD